MSVNRRNVLKLAASGLALSGFQSRKGVAQSPKRGGRLRFALAHGSTTDTLDPGTFPDAYMQMVGLAIRNTLTELRPDGEVEGQLAESWEHSADGKTWLFKLKRGVEFHNGKSLTAEDVVASLNHSRGKESKSAGKALLDVVSDLKALDNSSVQIELQNPLADLPAYLSVYFFSIMPSKDGKADWQSGTGTGGYTLKHFEPGVRAELARFPNYWRSDRAFVEEAVLFSVKDIAARMNALVTGEVDVIDKVDIKTLQLLKRNQNLKIVENTGGLHYTLPMRTDTSPFDNNEVRLALKHAIDREAMVKVILLGHGSPGNDIPIGPRQKYHAADIPLRPYDPDKARFYLKKAGIDKLTVDLSVADAAFEGAVNAGILYREQAEKANIDINVIREPNDGYWDNVWMKKPWSASYWSGGITSDYMFTHAYSAEAKWNETFWRNDQFNGLLTQFKKELDESRRIEMMREMQLLVRDEGGAVIPMFANFILGLSDKVQHDQMSTEYDLDGTRAVERWWLI